MTDTIRSTEADDSFLASRIAEVSRPTFSADFAEWLASADMAEIMDAYVESYKEAHGIKARWLYGATISRVEFADMFVSLGHEIVAEREREEAIHLSFRERASLLGLADWLAFNGITTTYDLMDLECRQAWQATDPEPLPYEHMVPEALAAA